ASIDAAFAAWVAGVTASGGCNAVLTNNATAAPNACTGGVATVTWTVTSDCEADVTCSAMFTVTDIADPTVTLNGPSTLSLCVGDAYTEQGATATDGCSGDVTGSIVITGGPVNTALPGVYILT